MHIYYYYKDGYVYVMDSNRKLYRYTVTNNIELILNTENLITEYTTILNEDPIKFHFKALKEFSPKEQYNLNQFLLSLGVWQQHYFPTNGTLLYFIELLGILNINHCYSAKKEKTDKETFKYEKILEELLQDLYKQLEFLNHISPYSKEEVSYEYIDSTCEKHYVNSIEDITKSYDEEIDFLLEANLSSLKFFNDPLLEETEVSLDTDCQQYINKKRRIIKQLYEQCPEEIKEKFQFDTIQKTYALAINNILRVSIVPFLLKLLRNNFDLDIPEWFFSAFHIYLLLGVLYNGSLIVTKGKELKKVNDPILSLRKPKKD